MTPTDFNTHADQLDKLRKGLGASSIQEIEKIRSEAREANMDFYKMVASHYVKITYLKVSDLLRNEVKILLFVYSYGRRSATFDYKEPTLKEMEMADNLSAAILHTGMTEHEVKRLLSHSLANARRIERQACIEEVQQHQEKWKTVYEKDSPQQVVVGELARVIGRMKAG